MWRAPKRPPHLVRPMRVASRRSLCAKGGSRADSLSANVEEVAHVPVLLDAAGRRRSPATLPGYHAGRPPRNRGHRYPADPPRVEEIVQVMRETGERPHGVRLRALVVVLSACRPAISEALALAETDLERSRGSLLVRHGKGDKRREVGWTSGRGNSSPVAQPAPRFADRATGLRHQRSDPRSSLDPSSGAARATSRRDASRRQTTVCATPAPPRQRSRTRTRGRRAKRDPTPARTRESRSDLGLPPGHR